MEIVFNQDLLKKYRIEKLKLIKEENQVVYHEQHLKDYNRDEIFEFYSVMKNLDEIIPISKINFKKPINIDEYIKNSKYRYKNDYEYGILRNLEDIEAKNEVLDNYYNGIYKNRKIVRVLNENNMRYFLITENNSRRDIRDNRFAYMENIIELPKELYVLQMLEQKRVNELDNDYLQVLEDIKNRRIYRFAEIINEYNTRGEKIGEVDKDIAHQKGLWHKSVHVWVINDNNEILLQYRCKDKDLYPNTWDCSFAGHINSYENSIDALVREGKEELGIDINLDKLEYVFTTKEILKYNDVDNREFVDIFILRQNIKLEDIKFQEEEVSGAKYVNYDEFFKLIDDNKLLPHDIEYSVLKITLKNNGIKNKLLTKRKN